jgi:hypothetical protein
MSPTKHSAPGKREGGNEGKGALALLHLIIFKTIAALVFLLAFRADAQETAKPAFEPPKLNVRFYQQNTPFSGEITRGILVAKESQFSFVLPAGFRRQIDAAEKKISLTSTSYTCAITAKIFETATDGQAELNPDTLRARLLGQYKDAKILDEFSASIESRSGPAFELEWVSEMGQRMTTRAAFVPYAAGHVEFSVQAPTSEIRQYDHSLNQLLLSIRTSPVGKELAVQEFLSEL